MERPGDIDQYKEWLKQEHGYRVDAKTERYYETVSLFYTLRI